MIIPTNGFLEFLVIDALISLSGIIAMKNLGSNLNSSVLWNQLGWYLDAIDNFDARIDNGIVLHIGHGNKVMYFGDAEIMQGVRHQCLKPSILDPSDLLGAIEVLLSGIAAGLAFAGVVDKVLGDLAERSALLAKIDDESATSLLGGFDAFLDGVREVRAARADVASEDVGSVAFVVYPAGEGDVLVGDSVGISPDVDGEAADGG